MTSTMPLALILLAVLCFSFYFLVQAEGGWGELPRLFKRVGINTDKILNPKSEIRNKSEITNDSNTGKITVPGEFTSGDSRFSQGKCGSDSDCSVGGCSGEICSSESDVISTCEYEYSDSFPGKDKYTCGCVGKVCGWKSK